jgi:hypothetical protein
MRRGEPTQQRPCVSTIKAQKAFHANRERLKAERLARDTLNGSS